MFNHPNPDDPVVTMFIPTTPFWETTIDQAISQFGSTYATNVPLMGLNPRNRRNFPYLLPSHFLGRYLNMPSSQVVANALVTRLSAHSVMHTTPVEISQSVLNPT